MPALIAWLVNIGQAVVAWIAGQEARRYAVTLATVAALAVIVVSLKTYLDTLIASVAVALPASAAEGFAMLPSNIDECVTACLLTKAAAWLARTKYDVIVLKNQSG